MEKLVKNLGDTQSPQDISEEQVYELFYWMDDREWQSFEKQEAKKQLLQFRIPSDALFYLKNCTTEKVTKVFTVQDGTVQGM
jgi:hypothetical protein